MGRLNAAFDVLQVAWQGLLLVLLFFLLVVVLVDPLVGHYTLLLNLQRPLLILFLFILLLLLFLDWWRVLHLDRLLVRPHVLLVASLLLHRLLLLLYGEGELLLFLFFDLPVVVGVFVGPRRLFGCFCGLARNLKGSIGSKHLV